MKKCKMICDDVNCVFRNMTNSERRPRFSCTLDMETAMNVLHKYGISTCEIGMNQELINNNPEFTKKVRNALIQYGRGK